MGGNFKQESAHDVREPAVEMMGKAVLGSENHQCKGPEARSGLGC